MHPLAVVVLLELPVSLVGSVIPVLGPVVGSVVASVSVALPESDELDPSAIPSQSANSPTDLRPPHGE